MVREWKIPTRGEHAYQRKLDGLSPATYNYSDPPLNMKNDPFFNAIWNEIKTWDINVPTEYSGYMAANENHVMAILTVINDAILKYKNGN